MFPSKKLVREIQAKMTPLEVNKKGIHTTMEETRERVKKRGEQYRSGWWKK